MTITNRERSLCTAKLKTTRVHLDNKEASTGKGSEPEHVNTLSSVHYQANSVRAEADKVWR